MNRTRPLGPTDRLRHAEHVWGTVVSFDVAAADLDPAEREGALERAVAWLHDVDRLFSPFREDSAVSGIRRDPAARRSAPSLVEGVLAACERIRELTDGVFDPWAMSAGLDPSGYVKGWAADRAADLLVDAGATEVCVNAGGDVSVRGSDAPWRVGVRDPRDATAVCALVEVRSGAVATSGSYERGLHIVDPRTGRAARGVLSATVTGPEGGLADALATALVVAGRDGASWFDRLPGWSACVIDDRGLWAVGDGVTAPPTRRRVVRRDPRLQAPVSPSSIALPVFATSADVR